MSLIKDSIMEDLETRYYARISWLSNRGYDEGDVMEDEDGEYILQVNETEGIYGPMKQVYLPTYLQKIHD